MKTEIDQEWELIERSKKDPENFKHLYEKYFKTILKFIHKRIDSVDDAADVTSNTFVKAFENIGKYKHQGFAFSSWLHRIAINEINQFYRSTSKQRLVCIDDVNYNYMAAETGKDLEELKANLQLAMEHLTTDELELLELRFFEERPFSEVAQILNITENNAKTKKSRLIDKMRVIFNKIN